PTTALDATVAHQVLNLLEDLQRERGNAMILISHDIRVVARTASRLGVMYAGEFVEYGRADAIFASPQHPYTEALLTAAPSLEAADARTRRLATIPGAPPRLGEWPATCRFMPRCPYADEHDECRRGHPHLREIAPEHLVRTAHPAWQRREKGGL